METEFTLHNMNRKHVIYLMSAAFILPYMPACSSVSSYSNGRMSAEDVISQFEQARDLQNTWMVNTAPDGPEKEAQLKKVADMFLRIAEADIDSYNALDEKWMAQGIMSALYRLGKGVPKDPERSAYWKKKEEETYKEMERRRELGLW